MNKTMSLLIFIVVLLHLIYAAFLFLTGGMVYLHYVVRPNWKIHDEDQEIEQLDDFCPPSTTVLEDLVIPATMPSEIAARQAKRHGSAIVRDVITNSTLNVLREMVMDANADTVGKGNFIFEPEHRAKLILGHRQITPMLKEMGSHSVLHSLLEGLLGPASSLVAFDTITAYPGAVGQHWHQDTDCRFNNNPSKFIELWAAVIPLQDTTTAMGATGICPGTHLCDRPSVSDTTSYETTWDASPELQDKYESFEDWMYRELPFCQMRAETKAGDVFLYNSDLYHRGEAHVDATAMDRAVIFITFAESRIGPNDDRIYPTGFFYNMNWDSWGHTNDDLVTIDSWWPWQPFGFFNSQREGRIPWSIPDFMAVMWMKDYESSMVFTKEGVLTADFVEEQTWRAVQVAKTSIVVYARGAGALLAVYMARSVIKKVFGIPDSSDKVKGA